MYKVGVIGEINSIRGFLALGLTIFPCEDKQTAADSLSRCARGEFAVVYITEQAAALIPEEIDKYRGAMLPAVIPIPGISGSLGIGMGNVKRFVERAVGSDIIGE